MDFKEMLKKDLTTTFYNTKEFAELKRIEYDGVVKNIPVIFDYDEAKERNKPGSDNAEGIYAIDVVVRIRFDDLQKAPRQGARIYINNDLFKITNFVSEYGELIIDLERFDE